MVLGWVLFLSSPLLSALDEEERDSMAAERSLADWASIFLSSAATRSWMCFSEYWDLV